MGAGIPKQFLEVAGKPLLRWSYEAIVSAGIDHVVVVVPHASLDQARRLVPEATDLVAGGDTRQASVRNGLDVLETEHVIVHDAARPFAPAGVFHAVLDALGVADGAVPGLQMKETVKIVRDRSVVRTLQREEVWNIQTPQAFRAAVLRDAHRRARSDGTVGTDDAQLVEHYGGRVAVVPGDIRAFKVTDADDVRRAEALVTGKLG